MNEINLRELDELCDRAAELSEFERGEFLNRVCVGRPDLRCRIEAALGDEPDLGLVEQVKEGVAAEVAFASTPRPGLRILDRYVIEQDATHPERPREVGRGGMGVVYAAHDDRLSSTDHVALRAIKMISIPALTGSAAREGFRSEAHALAYLNDPAFVTVYDVGEWGKRPFVVMELVGDRTAAVQRSNGQWVVEVMVPAGRSVDVPILHAQKPRCLTLADREPGRLNPRDAAELVEALARAVALAHDRRIVHRDLKPANILLANRRLKVADFGLARFLENASGLSRVHGGAVLAFGTPGYMAPEQWSGNDGGPAADVFALGVILYEMIAGVDPWQVARPTVADPTPLPTQLRDVRATLQYEFQRTTAPPIPLASRVRSIPPELSFIVMRCLAHNPADRYPSARELATDLERFRQHLPVGQPGLPRRLRLRARRNPLQTALGALAIVLAIVAIGLGIADELRYTRAKIAELRTVDPTFAPSVAAELRARGWSARMLLDREIGRADHRDSRSLRLYLPGLVPGAEPPAELLNGAVRSQVPIAEYFLLCRELRASRIRPAAYPAVETADAAVSLRTAGLRAALDPDSAWDDESLAWCARQLATAPVAELGEWAELFRPIRNRLRPHMEAFYRSSTSDPVSRQNALSLLVRQWSDDPDAWAALWYLAEPEHSSIVWATDPGDPVSRAKAIAARLPLIDASSEPAQDEQARNRAKGHLALARLRNLAELAEPLHLKADPRTRTYAIHLLRPLQIESGLILAEIERQAAPGGDPGVIQALLLALGEYPSLRDAELRRNVWPLLDRWDEPGVRAAAHWLLLTRATAATDILTLAELQNADRRVPHSRDANSHRLFQGPNGHLLVLLERPPDSGVLCGDAQPDENLNRDEWHVDNDDFALIKPDDAKWHEGLRDRDRSFRKVAIPGRFVIATHETTVGQFKEFMARTRKPPQRFQFAPTPSYFPTAEHPAGGVSWTAAALYCLWLTEQEFGPGEEYQCYRAVPVTEENPDTKMNLLTGYRAELVNDFRTRKGYRLPTEAEWEYAARAGSNTRRSYGNDLSLLPKYANYLLNSAYGPQRVGSLRPNPFGLFDTLGNVFEWCEYDDSRFPDYPFRNVRGGSFFNKPGAVRSAYRLPFSIRENNNILGFRIVRSVADDSIGQ